MTTKICSKCRIEKNITEFGSHKGHKDGLTCSCIICENKRKQEWSLTNKEKIKVSRRKTYYKNQEKILNREKEYRDSRPEIMKERKANFYLKNKDKILEYEKQQYKIIGRNSHLKRTYGLTGKDYSTLWNKQNGVCAICGQPETDGKMLCVDHDHISGKVRGLLCGWCNRKLEPYKDASTEASIEYHVNCISYLKKEL